MASKQRRDHESEKSEEGETRTFPGLPVLISVTRLQFLSWGGGSSSTSWTANNISIYTRECVFQRVCIPECVFQRVCTPVGVCTREFLCQSVCTRECVYTPISTDLFTGTETTAAGLKMTSSRLLTFQILLHVPQTGSRPPDERGRGSADRSIQ